MFLIFLYQRWIYKVDPTRVNEYGTSGESDDPPIEGEPEANGATEAIADKPMEEKKDD